MTKGESDEKMQRAIRRLERRLGRAADVIERSLGDLDKLQSVPPASIARQLWMVQIGASLVARQVYSNAGTPFVALSPSTFARYILRVARALVGSRRGGFLDRLPFDLWHTPDGEMVTAWARLFANLRRVVSGERYARQRVNRRRDLNSPSTWPVHYRSSSRRGLSHR